MKGKIWRQQLLEALNNLFVQKNSALYGVNHALAVERKALSLFNQNDEIKDKEIQHAQILQIVSLLHDVGFSRQSESWTIDNFEHINFGIAIARQVLQNNKFFIDNPQLIEDAISLIKHHDDTTYSYPSANNNGKPFAVKAQNPNSIYLPHITTLLRIVREADAYTHANQTCLKLAYEEWLNNGIPKFSNGVAPLGTWQWMDSAIGNLRLIGKRLVVDTHPNSEQESSSIGYDRVEEFIRRQCEIDAIPYKPEVCKPLDRLNSLKRINKNFNLVFMSFSNMHIVEDILRDVRLHGDKQIRPYQNAKITLDLIDTDNIAPMAQYVMENRLDEILEIYDVFMSEYFLSIFDIPGLVTFKYNSNHEQRIAAPLVENYLENFNNTKSIILGLIDGLHRCVVARNIGIKKMRAIVASEVPYPIVPLPIEWNMIKVYKEKPTPEMARKYRFPSVKDFPKYNEIKSVPVTDEEARYYFYRELDKLGSKGKRIFRKHDEVN